MHATGPLKLSKCKTVSFIYFLNFLRPTITMNEQLCLEVLLSKYIGCALIQTGHLIGFGG